MNGSDMLYKSVSDLKSGDRLADDVINKHNNGILVMARDKRVSEYTGNSTLGELKHKLGYHGVNKVKVYKPQAGWVD